MPNLFSRPLVSTAWLEDHLQDPQLRVFDTTTFLDRTPSGLKARSGREDYESAHVPGAGFLDIISDLSDTESKLAYTRPQAAQIERVLSKSGVSSDSLVMTCGVILPCRFSRPRDSSTLRSASLNPLVAVGTACSFTFVVSLGASMID